MTLREVSISVEAILKRKQSETELQAAMHGLKLEVARPIDPVQITPEQEAALRKSLAETLERKKAEARANV